MRSVFVVPRRADHGRRDELWAWCKPHWEALGDVFEGDHEDGPFNRGAAINKAVASIDGDWDVVFVIDADVDVPAEQIIAAGEQAHATGRACFAFTDYFALRQIQTDTHMAGGEIDWRRGVEFKMLAGRHVSSCIAVPRKLWDEVQGFDERFVGWGAEDIAFMQSCRVLGGGVDRVPGHVLHLWHPTSPERNKKLPDYQAGEHLGWRYSQTTDPDVMRSLVSTRSVPDAICLLIMTDGRRETIDECLPTALRHLSGASITRRLIHDDSGDADYAAWLRLRFPEFEIISTGKRSGFGGAMRNAWKHALASGEPWIFHIEDDFRFHREIPLDDMQAAMRANPHLTQMALMRQPWFPSEVEAGGVVAQHGREHFEQRDGFFEHARFFTTNPCLVPRSIVAHGWPGKSHSESLFGRTILTGGRKAGYWGSVDDEPWVEHTGVRSGTGY